MVINWIVGILAVGFVVFTAYNHFRKAKLTKENQGAGGCHCSCNECGRDCNLF